MTITLEPELEQKVQEAAKRAGQDVQSYVGVLLMRQLAAQENAASDRQTRKDKIRRDAEAMAADPMVMQDIAETMEDYKYIDSETARIMGKEDMLRRSVVDVLAEVPGQRLFKTAEEVDAYIKEERDGWDR